MSGSSEGSPEEPRARADVAEALRTSLGASPIPVVVIDREGRVRGGWNQAATQLLGWERREARGRTLVELLEPRPVGAEGPGDEILCVGDLTGPGDPLKVQVRTRAGRLMEVVLSRAPLPGPDGSSSGAIVFLEDRSHFKTLEAQLRQAQKLEAIGQLTGGIAHDFNNLLTIVQTSAELLGELTTGPEAAEYLSDIAGAVRRGSDLVRRLMAFARNDPATLKVLDAGRLVSSYAGTLRRVLPDDIQVRVTVGGTVPSIRADEGAIQQILLNLATNARDAMPSGGVLFLDVSRAAPPEAAGEDWTCITVRDTGPGIPPEVRSRVFEPFFTTKTAERGTGLGLSMVRELVRQLSGAVTVDASPAGGTEFRLFFPEADQAEETPVPQPETEPRAVPAGADTGTILIVEDDASVRKVVRRALTGVGYDVIVTADGEQALAAFRQHDGPIDLVLSDLVMPNMDGAALFQEMRRVEGCPPFLFISGYGEQDPRVDAIIAEGIPILTKPWSVTDLCDAVRSALKRATDSKEGGQPVIGTA